MSRFPVYPTILLVVLASVFPAMAQSNANAASPSPAISPAISTTGLPKFLNMVHQELKPGRSGAYQELAMSLARTESRENIANYWLELESVSGPPEVLHLGLFDSAAEMGKAMDALNGGLAADPKLQQMQNRLLEENIASASSVLGIRRDDLGYRTNTIDLSKMRLLRLTTIFARPGFERAFKQAEYALSEGSERVNAKLAWAVYEVSAGLPQPSFIIVTPMQSIDDMEDALKTNQALEEMDGGAFEEHQQELGRVVSSASDSQLFSVDQKTSHVSPQFAAGDPAFWSPAPPASAKKATEPSRSPGAPVPRP